MTALLAISQPHAIIAIVALLGLVALVVATQYAERRWRNAGRRSVRGGSRNWEATVALTVIVWEVVVILADFHLIDVTWPGNRCAFQEFERRHYLSLALVVTDDSLMKIRQGEIALSRWELQGAGSVTMLDRRVIGNAVFLGSDIYDFDLDATPPPKKNKPQITAPSWSYWMWAHLFIWDDGDGSPVLPFKPTPPALPIENPNPLLTLPTGGDLSTIPRSILNATLSELNCAAKGLRERKSHLAALSATNQTMNGYSPASLRGVCQPPFTTMELAEFGSRFQTVAEKDGVYWFCSRVMDLLILMVAVAAMGAAARALASIGKFIGAGKFRKRWAPYYLLRPVEAAVLAVGYFLLIPGGMLNLPVSSSNSSEAPPSGQTPVSAPPVATFTNLNATNSLAFISAPTGSPTTQQSSTLFGFCALAFMIGMFSDEATKKLAKIAESLFTDNTASDALDDPSPSIISGFGVPLFSLESVTNLREFALRLKNASDPPSQFIAGHASFSPAALALHKIEASQIKDDDMVLKHAIIDGLNGIIQAGAIFEEKRFENIQLQRSAILLSKNPVGLNLVLLNRLLLLDVYGDTPTPTCLAAVTTRWLVELDGDGFGPGANVTVGGNKLPTTSNLAIQDAHTLRFEHQQAAPAPRDEIAVVVSSPAATASGSAASTVWSENATVLLDASVGLPGSAGAKGTGSNTTLGTPGTTG